MLDHKSHHCLGTDVGGRSHGEARGGPARADNLRADAAEHVGEGWGGFGTGGSPRKTEAGWDAKAAVQRML
jgi:hypothetical protein